MITRNTGVYFIFLVNLFVLLPFTYFRFLSFCNVWLLPYSVFYSAALGLALLDAVFFFFTIFFSLLFVD